MKKIFLLLMIVTVSLSACAKDELYDAETFEKDSIDKEKDSKDGEKELSSNETSIENENTPSDDLSKEDDSNVETSTDEEAAEENSQDDSSKDDNKTETTEAEQEKIMAPDFSLTDRDGNEVSLEDYRGKILFLNFFTTWCKYCDQEMPEFQAAVEAYPDDLDFLLVDVFTQENVSVDDVYDWYDERDLTMDMVIDVDGELLRDYPIQAFPTTFFIDRDGSVLAYFPGAMTGDMIEQVIDEFK